MEIIPPSDTHPNGHQEYFNTGSRETDPSPSVPINTNQSLHGHSDAHNSLVIVITPKILEGSNAHTGSPQVT